jgi:hypothetical protein
MFICRGGHLKDRAIQLVESKNLVRFQSVRKEHASPILKRNKVFLENMVRKLHFFCFPHLRPRPARAHDRKLLSHTRRAPERVCIEPYHQCAVSSWQYPRVLRSARAFQGRNGAGRRKGVSPRSQQFSKVSALVYICTI